MDSDMREDLEKYKEEYEQIKREMAKARFNKASDEEIDNLRKKMRDILFRIKVLDDEIENVNELGGKRK